MRAARHELIAIGPASFRVRHWGQEDAPLIVMCHGWLDCGATFQFLVDAMTDEWHIVAPDHRGHGGSHRTHEPYCFLQRVADLDALLDYYCADGPVRILGHSMGANIASIYAGVRPKRVSHFVNLEGMAPIPGRQTGSPAAQIERWLSDLRAGPANRVYENHEQLAKRLMQANPRLLPDRAQFLASEFFQARESGELEFDLDPFVYVSPPVVGHREMVESAWPMIEAPVLFVTGADSFAIKAYAKQPGLLEQRLAMLRRLQYVHLPGAGHNLHHDVPEQLGPLIESFFRSTAAQ